MCGFFKTRAKSDPEGTHRSLWSLYLLKHKDKPEANFNSFEQQKAQQPQPQQQQEEERNYNQPLGQDRMAK